MNSAAGCRVVAVAETGGRPAAEAPWVHVLLTGLLKHTGCRAVFAILRKATISFVMSVRLSARVEQLGSHWTDFYEI